MNQYSKRQLKTPKCFGSFGIHPQGVLVLKSPQQKHTQQVQISRCQTPTTHTKHLK